jgi:putative GTP pyrophosphokinase
MRPRPNKTRPSHLPIPRGEAEAVYDRDRGRWEQLQQEAVFSLQTAVSAVDLKTHSISARVKTRESFLEKVERKGYSDPFEENEDFVGVRVVTLFLSDLPKLDEIVSATFTVLSRDDRIAGESAELFGYMSVHYICRVRPDHTGPRYDGIKDLKFEIQVRTILMDAWANVSHYLAYKGDASIPAELKRDFLALSGLFYVADQHFELFFRQALVSQESALDAIEHDTADSLDLNLETTLVFLRKFYPDRNPGQRTSVSDFVEEAAQIGISTVGELEKSLARVRDATLAYEEEHPPAGSGSGRYLGVGMARNGLALSHPEFKELLRAKAEAKESP